MKKIILMAIFTVGTTLASTMSGSVDKITDENAETSVRIRGEVPVTTNKDIDSKRARIALAKRAAKVCKAAGGAKYLLEDVTVLVAGTVTVATGDLSCARADGGQYFAVTEAALKL